ncbi:hypothetical protein AOLI_G00150820 [Acnodon oligacanthus]
MSRERRQASWCEEMGVEVLQGIGVLKSLFPKGCWGDPCLGLKGRKDCVALCGVGASRVKPVAPYEAVWAVFAYAARINSSVILESSGVNKSENTTPYSPYSPFRPLLLRPAKACNNNPPTR